MPKTRETLLDAADSIKPYIERAMTDEKLRRRGSARVRTAAS